ncbi:hypothetical protein HK098_003775 [Nowakowskiella sp. JEL0407]|nr:hypothetical protein HK098_003775 [Nowakowskiella sp. JEL0407]
MSTQPSNFAPSKASQGVAEGDYRVMEKTWETMQKKTFTNWINNKLKLKEYSPIVELNEELSSGEKLIQLLEIIGDESLGRYNKSPRLRIQKVENINTALAFIKRRGVNLTNIGAEDIVDSNPKLILGEEGLTAKEGLLLWCQRRTTPYAADFQIKEFTFSWQSGLALCGLIHRHRPDLIDYWNLDKSKKHENTQLAFDVAEQYLGIPKLFGVEDLVDVAKPDERSVMTYIAQYFHAFSVLGKVDAAGRRVGQFGQVMNQIYELQNDYERRVLALMDGTSAVQNEWSKSTFAGYPDAKRQLVAFETYKNTVKRGWVAEKRDLDSLLSNIQTKLHTYKLAPYVPPAGLTPQDLGNSWNALIKSEAARKKAITAYIGEIKQVLRQKYADAANGFQVELNKISASLASLDGELEGQLQTVQSLIMQLEPLKSSLKNIEQLNEECIEASIEDNEYTIYSVEDLSFDYGILAQTLAKKSTFIQNQMVARGVSNLTPQQLEEYTETFRHFDKDHFNRLEKEQFKAAMAALGTGYSDEEFEEIFPKVSKGTANVTFEMFIEHMKSIEEDRTTPEQLVESFRALAQDKPYITDKDMLAGQLPPDVIEYYKKVIPRGEDGFDYKSYINEVFK